MGSFEHNPSPSFQKRSSFLVSRLLGPSLPDPHSGVFLGALSLSSRLLLLPEVANGSPAASSDPPADFCLVLSVFCLEFECLWAGQALSRFATVPITPCRLTPVRFTHFHHLPGPWSHLSFQKPLLHAVWEATPTFPVSYHQRLPLHIPLVWESPRDCSKSPAFPPPSLPPSPTQLSSCGQGSETQTPTGARQAT